MVRSGVELKVFLRRLIGLNGQARVVNETIKHRILFLDNRAKFLDRVKARQIELERNQFAFIRYLTNFLDSFTSFLHVPACHDDGGSSHRQCLGGLIAETSIGTGNDKDFSSQ